MVDSMFARTLLLPMNHVVSKSVLVRAHVVCALIHDCIDSKHIFTDCNMGSITQEK